MHQRLDTEHAIEQRDAAGSSGAHSAAGAAVDPPLAETLHGIVEPAQE
jgi:hypothetical protein